jgi:hypothetical protein
MKIKNWNAIQTSRDISSDYQEQTWQDIRKGLFTFVPTSIVVVLEDHYGLN